MGLFDSIFNRQMIRPPALWLPTHALGAKDDRLGGSLFEPPEKYDSERHQKTRLSSSPDGILDPAYLQLQDSARELKIAQKPNRAV
jgi:hypothetical protein